MTTMEHISRYLIQLGETSIEEAHKVRFFPMSLSRPAFSWFSSLEPNSITGWADLENKFHTYFESGLGEKKMTNLTSMRQRNNELGSEFIQGFREIRSHCYSLNLSNGQLAKLVLQGMSLLIKEKFDGQEFESLAHLMQRVSAFENQHRALCKEKYLKGTAAMTDPMMQTLMVMIQKL
jgi:DNA-binding ferritin-like protein (Dps family)